MNRRDFTRGLLSLSAVPALPLSGAAAASTGAAASASASHMYFMGWYTARLNKTCSPDMLVSKLNVDKEVAQEIFGKLVANRTVSPPDALGISRTLNPLPRRIRPSSGSVVEKSKDLTKSLKERLETVLEDDEGDEVPAAEVVADEGAEKVSEPEPPEDGET